MDDIKTTAAKHHEDAAHGFEAAAKMHHEAARHCASGNFEGRGACHVRGRGGGPGQPARDTGSGPLPSPR